MILMLAILLAQTAAPERSWDSGDPLVEYAEDSQWGGVSPLSNGLGAWEVDISCTIAADYALTACEAVRVEPPDTGLQSGGPDSVSRVRLKETAGGPRPGDTILFQMRVETEERIELVF